MQKIALLIGVSDYKASLASLPSALKDIEAMKHVLQHPEMGEFLPRKNLAQSHCCSDATRN